jgi:hypothetical protein
VVKITRHKLKYTTYGGIKEMNNYVGKYRVKPELYYDDKKQEVRVSPETYLDCYHKVEIFRFDKDTLAMKCPNTSFFNARVRKMKSASIWHEVLDTDDGGIIYFREKDFEKLHEIKIGKSQFFKCKISGKNINPKSKKNIPKKYKDNPQLFLDEMGGY